MQHFIYIGVSKTEMEMSLKPVFRKRDETYSIVKRCQEGDQIAFQILYDQYAKAMYNTSFRILNNHADAEDVLQEAFIDAFRHIGSFDGRSTFGYWLKRIVVNHSINEIRKRKNKFLDLDEQHELSDQQEHDHSYDVEYQAEHVVDCIQKLPSGYRTVISLYLLEGYDHQEIAQILNVAESTTRTQYMRAKKKLQQMLKSEMS